MSEERAVFLARLKERIQNEGAVVPSISPYYKFRHSTLELGDDLRITVSDMTPVERALFRASLQMLDTLFSELRDRAGCERVKEPGWFEGHPKDEQ